MISEEFVTNEWLRQSGLPIPTLFKIILVDVTKEAKSKINQLDWWYRNVEPVAITESTFADDLTIYTRNGKELQSNLVICIKHYYKGT